MWTIRTPSLSNPDGVLMESVKNEIYLKYNFYPLKIRIRSENRTLDLMRTCEQPLNRSANWPSVMQCDYSNMVSRSVTCDPNQCSHARSTNHIHNLNHYHHHHHHHHPRPRPRPTPMTHAHDRDPRPRPRPRRNYDHDDHAATTPTTTQPPRPPRPP